MTHLQDQHIIVVGGSSGIGLAVAATALRAGARVSIMARSRARLDRARQQLDAGDALQTVAVDVTDESTVQLAFAGLPAPDHVHVSAAGFVGGSVLGTPMTELRAALDARLWGAVHVVRAAAPRMTAGGSFVLTGGISTERPAKGAWPTAVATAAAEQLARCLALELAPLRFNAIAPGWTDTPMWDGLLGASKADTFAAVAGRTPTGRLVTADEAAQAVLLLMSNASLNGEILHIDGGLRLA
ncbi:SDR family oxidoreductase [Roseateles puraquae]|uniref:Short chain dehydrogenase n=1 Tax=Roseateles puraquae TaxID=431059 RepID=A0A254N5D0_9BURK|nr:SDR family oxidoreductase [Roseateles puraquae]MDG0853761.1 SDR family oxidoreductase [Roseateles puraquae]OWR02804.1 short chain dehydrogenase [Roseateles puraquae]